MATSRSFGRNVVGMGDHTAKDIAGCMAGMGASSSSPSSSLLLQVLGCDVLPLSRLRHKIHELSTDN